MIGHLFARTLREKSWFVVGWSVVLIAMTTIILTFYPSFSDTSSFDTIAQSLPAQLRGFIGNPNDFKSIDGFIALQIYDIRMSLLLIIMTLALAVGMTVREEESGELRTMLLISRSRAAIVYERLVAAIFIILILNLVAVIGIYVGITALGETYPHALIWKLFGLSCVFSVAAFSIPFGTALASGSRSITMAAGVSVALGSYLLSTFARSVAWLESWEHLSLMHYFDTAGIRHGTFNAVNVITLCCVVVGMVALGIAIFRHRDIY